MPFNTLRSVKEPIFGMKLFNIFLFCFCLQLGFVSQAQSNSQRDSIIERTPLFTEAESQYISQWFVEFVEDMNLSIEVAGEYQMITSKYSEKFDGIEKSSSDLNKSQIMEKFSSLMTNQNEEIKSILTEEQYKTYITTMERVSWSINQRLKQL